MEKVVPGSWLANLIEKLKSDDPAERDNAAVELGSHPDRRALPALLKAAKDPDARVRTHSIWTIGRIGDPSGREALLEALKDADKTVSHTAFVSLMAMGVDQQQKDIVLKLIKTGTAREKVAAIKTLEISRDFRAIADLIQALGDQAGEVRAEAAHIISLFSRQYSNYPQLLESVPLLIRLLDDPGAAMHAARALGELRDRRAVAPLIKALEKEELRDDAVIALGKIKDPAATIPLTVTLRDRKKGIREHSADALAEIADPAAVPALIEALKDSYWVVVCTAARALGRIGDTGAIDALNPLVNEHCEKNSREDVISYEAKKAIEQILKQAKEE